MTCNNIKLDPTNNEIKFNNFGYTYSTSSQLFATLDQFLLSESTTDEISIIVNAYAKLGFNLDLSKVIEIIEQEPRIKSSLKVALDFFRIVKTFAIDEENLHLIEQSILKFISALAIVSTLSETIQIPLLKKLTDLSLIYIQFLLITKAKDEKKSQELFGSIVISVLVTKDLRFINLIEALKSIRINKLIMELSQFSLNIGMAVRDNLAKENSINQNLLQLFMLLSIKLQDLSIKLFVDNQETATVWQDLIQQFMELESREERKLGSKILNKEAVIPEEESEQGKNEEDLQAELTTNNQNQTINSRTTSSQLTSDPTVLAREKLIQTLNDNNHFAAASHLEDLSKEIDRLDLQYAELIKAKEQKINLPPILGDYDPFIKIITLEQKIPITNKFDILEFKLIKTFNDRIRLSVSCNNQKLPYCPWYTEVPLELCPGNINIPGFKGKVSLTKTGDLEIKYLPENFNYNFRINGNLYIENLRINGRCKAIVKGVIENHAVTIAKSGFLLLAKEINNHNGILVTFNVPTLKLNKLFKYLAIYRSLTTLLVKSAKELERFKGLKEKEIQELSQRKLASIKSWFKSQNIDLNNGKIYAQTTNLNNYNGSILSGDSCILRATKLNLHKSVIASHSDRVDLLNLGENSNINCCNNSIIWALTTLQGKSSRIIKDDTSILEGLKSTILHSFEGNLVYDGAIVGSNVGLIQENGFYYQYKNVKAKNLSLTTSVTSNLLEKKLHVDVLQLDVTDPNSYVANVAEKLLVSKQIKMRLPGVKILNKIEAGDIIEIYTPIYQLSQETGASLYTVNFNAPVVANKVIIVGHGVKQDDYMDDSTRLLNSVEANSNNIRNSNIISSINLSIVTCNLQLNIGFKVKENALLYATGSINYIPENFRAFGWLGLHFLKVSDFKFSKSIPGSLYAKVLDDNAPIALSQNLFIKDQTVVIAPGSVFGAGAIAGCELQKHADNQATNKVIKLHTGEEGSILIQAKGFNLTKEGLFGGTGIALLATDSIVCGTIDIPTTPQLEPYIFSNGNLTVATSKIDDESQNIVLRHANITSMEGSLFQGKEIQHIGINLSVGLNNGGLTYVGQPVVAHISIRTTEARSREFVTQFGSDIRKRGYHHIKVYRHYRNWEKITSRRNKVKTEGPLIIRAPSGFIGSGNIDLGTGSYTGIAHELGANLTATAFNFYELHESSCGVFSSIGDYVLDDSNNYGPWIRKFITPAQKLDYEHVYDIVKPSCGHHSEVNLTINNSCVINYNLIGEDVHLELRDNALTVGSKLIAIPKISELELTKEVKLLATNPYMQQVLSTLSANNVFTYQPIFPIRFNRPQLPIVVLRNEVDYSIEEPNKYALNHPLFEMQSLVETIKHQLGHQKVGDVGLNDKEIYYYMLSNALEHAKSGKPFSSDYIVKPMLVYKKNLDHSMQLESLLPKMLDIPELRANVGGIFCKLLTAKGSASSSIDLLGVIVAKEGGNISVGKLTILQQYRETSKLLFTVNKTRRLFSSKTTVHGEIKTEFTPIENTGKLLAQQGNWEINLIEFYAKGGSIVCLDGDIAVRVRDLIDLSGLLGNYFVPHHSRASTFLKTCSTSSFVERQYIVPFKLYLPQGSITVLCNGEVYAKAIEVLANAGYIKGEKLIELEPIKLWQQLGLTHTKRGMMLSSSWGVKQTASPCTFSIKNEMLFESAADGYYKDTGSLFTTGKGVTVKAGSVEIKPVALQTKIYTKSSGLTGFLYVKSNSKEEHLTHEGANYTAIDGDVIFHATSKDITACALKATANQGKVKFIAEQGKVYLSQASDQHHIETKTKSIGISFGMSDSILHAMRGDFHKAMQASIDELQVVKDVKGLLHAEGGFNQGVKGITAANSVIKSLVDLHQGGITGFIAGNLNQQVKLTFSREHKIVNFSEIIGNWLLAKEIIINAKKDITLEAAQAECQDLKLTSETGSINIDGGTASSSSSSNSCGINIGMQVHSQGTHPILGVQRSQKIEQILTHGVSHFKVTGETYISALKGEVAFRNAILEARKAYIEALNLTLESQRDEVLEKAKSFSIGTNINFNQSHLNSKWVQQQTGIKVSENLNIAIEQATNLIGAYIEVGAQAIPLSATYLGETQELYELLLPNDSSELGFKILGIPRAKAISQLFAKAYEPEYRAMLAPEIMQKLLNQELPESIIPSNTMTREELLAWASTKECYENYLGFYLALESTSLTLNKHANIGAMACIAKINNLQLRIWGKTIDQKLYWSVNHNENAVYVINIAVDNAYNYTRLSETPGMLISPTFSYSDVESNYKSEEEGLSIDQLVFGEMTAGIKLKNISKQQINFAHLSSNIKIQSNDEGPTSTIKQSEINVEKTNIEIDSGIIKKVSDLATNLGKLRAVLRQYDPKLQQALKLAEKEKQKAIEEEKAKEKEQDKKANLKANEVEVNNKKIVDLLLADQSELNYPFLITINSQEREKQQKMMGQYGLIDSKAKEAYDTRSRIGEKVLEFFMPAAYADDLSQSNDTATSSSVETNPKGLFSLFTSAINGDRNAQLEMRNRFPTIAEFSDGLSQELKEGKYRDEGAHKVAASIPEALVAIGTVNLAAAGVAADNAATGLWQMFTNKPQSSIISQGIAAIGEKTGLYDPNKSEMLSMAFNVGVMGVAGLPQKSKTMLYALDLTTRTSRTSRVTSGLANSVFPRASGLKNSAEVARATSSVSMVPKITPQQALNSGLLAGITIFGAKATKETIDTIQEFRKQDPDRHILPGFMPQPNTPTIYTTPVEQREPTVFTTPIHHSSGTALAGPAAEVKKPIIFLGGIDYKDKEFIDSLNELEKRNYVTPGMFEKIKPQVKWTGEQTFTWHGLEGRVEGKGKVKIENTQVHHIIPLKGGKPETYDFIKETGFNLEDDANKMVLPNKKGAAISGIDSAIHEGGHNQEYAKVIELELLRVSDTAKQQSWYDLPTAEFQANCQQEIKSRISKIRAKLELGDLVLNKNGSNKLNNGPKPKAGM